MESSSAIKSANFHIDELKINDEIIKPISISLNHYNNCVFAVITQNDFFGNIVINSSFTSSRPIFKILCNNLVSAFI